MPMGVPRSGTTKQLQLRHGTPNQGSIQHYGRGMPNPERGTPNRGITQSQKGRGTPDPGHATLVQLSREA